MLKPCNFLGNKLLHAFSCLPIGPATGTLRKRRTIRIVGRNAIELAFFGEMSYSLACIVPQKPALLPKKEKGKRSCHENEKYPHS